MGYAGALEIAKAADKALKNTTFAKQLAENLWVPLTDAWLASDIGENIKDPTEEAVA